MIPKEIGELEMQAAVIRGLIDYHDRLAFSIKGINQNPAIDMGLDVYRGALVKALELFSEKIGK